MRRQSTFYTEYDLLRISKTFIGRPENVTDYMDKKQKLVISITRLFADKKIKKKYFNDCAT